MIEYLLVWYILIGMVVATICRILNDKPIILAGWVFVVAIWPIVALILFFAALWHIEL